jgi:hypothetical protein
VSLIVRAAGVRGGKPFSGTFRNTRVFVTNAAGWQCVVWFNTREGKAAVTPGERDPGELT